MDSWSWLARKRSIRLLALVYFTSVCAVLLYPFEFVTSTSTTANTAFVRTDGIHFGASGELRTETAPVSLYDRLIAGEGLTLELWVRTASAEQGGLFHTHLIHGTETSRSGRRAVRSSRACGQHKPIKTAPIRA